MTTIVGRTWYIPDGYPQVIDTRLSTWPFPVHTYEPTFGGTASLLRLMHHFWHGGGADAPREARVFAKPPRPLFLDDVAVGAGWLGP